ERHAGRSWTAWEPSLRARLPAALAEARDTLAPARLFHEYVQWVAAEQWAAARREATAHGVRLMGDLPFMVSADSADVWARQDEFARDPSLGAPPDQFDLGGQDWGIPGYRVLRWESDGGVFRDPAGFPPLSVATSGTHDTSALAIWWEEELGADGRRALAAVPSFGRLAGAGAAFTPGVHEALLDGLY